MERSGIELCIRRNWTKNVGMKMKVKLGDIFEIGSGGTPSKSHPEYYGGNIPWVKTGDLKTTYLYNVEDFITEDGLNNSSAKMYEPDTVLIAMYGATIGATSILKINACTNQACAAFKPNDKVKPEYLYYFLRSKKNEFIKDGVGGAQPNISAGYLKKVSIELPEIKEQNEIIDILNKISNVVEMREKELMNLDILIKARFVELFGSIKETTKLASCCDRITDYVASGSFASIRENVRSYAQEEYAIMVKTADFANGFTKNLTYTDKHGYDFLHNSNLFGGELLLSNIGASIGKVHRVPNLNRPMTLAPNAIMIKGNKYFLDDYLQYFFLSHLGQRQLKEMTTATAMPKFNKTQLKEVIVPVAPIDLQNQFSAFVKQTDKSKIAVQKALDEAQLLFDSLMQKYFG